MTLYDESMKKLFRQELNLELAGQQFTYYSAKVKYAPESIEDPHFFDMCCGILHTGDRIRIQTIVTRVKAEESYNVLYDFVVVTADPEAKLVEVKLLSKLDVLNTDSAEIDTADTEAIGLAINALAKKVDDLAAMVNTYITETDDQLEEIENNIAKLEGLHAPVEPEAPVEAPKNAKAGK